MDHICETSVQHNDVDSASLDYGSGDTGRQSKLKIHPEDDVKKCELRDMAIMIDLILEEIFPTEFMVGIAHEFTIDNNEKPVETSEFFLFMTYQVRCHGSPSKPPGESTEVV